MPCLTKLYEQTGAPATHTSLTSGTVDLVAIDQTTRANCCGVQSNSPLPGTADHGAQLTFGLSAICLRGCDRRQCEHLSGRGRQESERVEERRHRRRSPEASTSDEFRARCGRELRTGAGCGHEASCMDIERKSGGLGHDGRPKLAAGRQIARSHEIHQSLPASARGSRN
jgi:hypothetical protein